MIGRLLAVGQKLNDGLTNLLYSAVTCQVAFDVDTVVPPKVLSRCRQYWGAVQ